MADMAQDYRVISQRQTSQLNPGASGFENVWEITYRVTDGPAIGTVGTVTVNENDHNADAIASAIEAKISDLHAIADLGMGQ
jgi:hypothetical protein